MRKLGIYPVMCGLVLFFCSVGFSQQAKVTVQVTDFDNGRAITNALVGLSVDTNIKPGWGWGGGRPNRYQGYTDTNGVCVLKGEGNGGTASVYAKQEGYYGSSGYKLHFTNVTGIVQREWEPWNSAVDVVLKRIGTPAPMYVKRIWEKEIPERGSPIGFDLQMGDWVAPHGDGKTKDLIFTYVSKPIGAVNTRYGKVTTYDYSLSVDFLNEGDGLYLVAFPPVGHGPGSSLRMPRLAPEAGYQKSIFKHVYRGQDMQSHSDIREDANYFVRVRTVKDADGSIVSALYGKIHGDFQFDHQEELTFTYYLNPTPNDRNVEFDPKHNLFKNLSDREQVRAP